jgi:hypothetical protein
MNESPAESPIETGEVRVGGLGIYTDGDGVEHSAIVKAIRPDGTVDLEILPGPVRHTSN